VKKKLIVGSLVAVGATLAVTAFGSVSAQADPYRSIVAVGSNTTEALYNAFGNGTDGYTANGFGALVASYDSVGIATIQTHTGGQQFTRPNGSGAGRKALSASWNDANHKLGTVTYAPGDVTISRSSGLPGTAAAWVSGSATNQETFIPMARDGVGVAIKSDTRITTLNLAQLEALYGAPNDPTHGSATASSGTWTQNAGRATVGDIVVNGTDHQIVLAVDSSNVATTVQTLKPRLPQSSSGTRQFFVAALGITGSATVGTWVDSSNSNEENTGSWLNADDIVPYSGAAAVAQNTGRTTEPSLPTLTFPTIVSPGFNGDAAQTLVIGSGTAALPGTIFGSRTAKPSYGIGDFSRDVYTVVPTSQLATKFTAGATQHDLQTIVSIDLPGLLDATASARPLVQDFGFLQLTQGYRTSQTNWYQNVYEN
jgi:hypothetical protein